MEYDFAQTSELENNNEPNNLDPRPSVKDENAFHSPKSEDKIAGYHAKWSRLIPLSLPKLSLGLAGLTLAACDNGNGATSSGVADSKSTTRVTPTVDTEYVIGPTQATKDAVASKSTYQTVETTTISQTEVRSYSVDSGSTVTQEAELPSRATPSHPEEPLPPFLQPTTERAARFLHQAQFHASDEDIQAIKDDGFETWLEKQLDMPIAMKGWDWMIQNGYNEYERRFQSQPMDFMMWQQLMTSADSVRKRIALALSEILVVSAKNSFGSMRAFSLAAYWDTLNEHALGNYRDLLEDMSLNLGMGYFLNTKGNRKEDEDTGRQPDENYARELLQLFTIGLHELNMDGSKKLVNGQPVETYTNDDVINLARVFTGYDRATIVYDTYDRPYATKARMQLNPSYHSLKEKSFLGLTIPANTDAGPSLRLALDHIFNHDNIAPFICKQLIQRLITSNPSPAYVERVARVFANNGKGVRGDMKSVVKAILLDIEARDDRKNHVFGFGKLREPMLRVLQWAKTFKATSLSGKWEAVNTSSTLWSVGQGFMHAPSVFNFFRPGYIPPNTVLAENNMVAPELQITNEINNTNYINTMRVYIERGMSNYKTSKVREITPNYSSELALADQPKALVTRLNLLLTAEQLSNATVLLITNTIASMKSEGDLWKERRVWAAVFLVMCAPEYLVLK